MAVRVHDPVRGAGKGLVVVAGTFFPAGTGAPTVTTATGGKGTAGGLGWTVARDSAGLFTVTFDRKYPVCAAKLATVQQSAAADLQANAGDYSSTAGTLKIRLLVGAVATDLAANANNSVSFVCVFSTHATP